MHAPSPRLLLAGSTAIAGTLALLFAIRALARTPRDTVRRVLYVVVHALYRVRLGAEDRRRLHAFVKAGPGIIVANHLSYADAILLGALAPRPMRFVMDHRIFRSPIVGAFFRFARAIPIASARDDADLKERAFAEVARALAAGETVCIFPEGRLTRDGQTGRFRPGIERILRDTPAAVLPVGLDGLWGSWLSYADGAPGASLPKRIRATVRVRVGSPLPPSPTPSAAMLEREVTQLVGASPRQSTSRASIASTSSASS